MLMPNKTISISESCIYKSAMLLSKIEDEVAVEELYRKEKKKFLDISDYLDALDLLFVLGKVVLDEESGVIRHA